VKLRSFILVVAVLSALLALGSAPVHAATGDEPSPAEVRAAMQSSDEPVVFVPIKAPAIEAAPNANSTGSAQRQTKPAAVSKKIASGFKTGANAPLVKLPGTSIPIWWVLLAVLAVPLAKLWRRWTARMFDGPVPLDAP
jgi:hypothetical protein